ncbi:MAG: histidinol-phosphate transaminase [Gammaproteobacteria bacterium MedPE]|nr:MAG: histidinol-phosphate transaminase [Gammaproteobacteria bacterium MedPE]
MSDVSLINRLARPELLTMTPYQSARRIGGSGDIWLNANESPFANSDPAYNRYPEFQPTELIENYARYSKLDNSQILASRGADEAIELLIRTFCVPGKDSITICTPTYGMYAISAATCNVAVNEVPLTQDWQLDSDLTTKLKGSSLLFICNPNNPTGSTMTPEDIEQIIEATSEQCIVVVDEAYIEFSAQLTCASLINQYNNVVVLRTLSKAFGLAGLRCGFMLANQHIITLAKKVIAPYPISAPVGDIAAQALTVDGVAQMRQQVSELNQLAQQFASEITPLQGVEDVYHSGGNFVLVRFNSDNWFSELGQAGIVVRNQSQVPTLERCLRFSIGNEEEMKKLTTTLIDIAKQTAA